MISRLPLRYWLGPLLLAGIAGTASAQGGGPGNSLPVDVANLREDVRGLSQRIGELTLRVEQLERENTDLRRKAGASEQSFATLTQLNDAIADLNARIKSSVASSREDILEHVGGQMKKLGDQTNAALDSLAKSMAVRPAAAPAFAGDYPKDGTSYTVQKGDTIAEIAKKTGAKQQDIINANKLSDPSHIVVGQTLVVPGGK